MKVVILAGGFGTRLAEETAVRPKPMAEIGGKPILWHIMKIFAAQGYEDFVIACGYKSGVIKEYFANYAMSQADVTFDLRKHTMAIHHTTAEPWRVTCVETGENSMTGGRILRVKDYVGNEPFFLTYGDGVSDIDLAQLLAFHKEQQATVTLSAVQPPGRFGAFTLHEGETKITHFREKPQGDGAWINGGFFVVEPAAFAHIANEQSIWEQEPLKQLAQAGKLAAYRHHGYWQNMDTLRDKTVLEGLWQSGKAPWKIWK